MGPRRTLLGALAVVAAAWLYAPRARAGELEDFQEARAAYAAGDYARAVSLFEELVGGTTPRLESEALVLESRKYLGAAYLFVGRRDAAEDQFELLLSADPTYELDPAAFPVEVVELFANVRERLAERARCEAERVLAEERRAYELERIRALVAFAEEEVSVDIENSRWIAAIPLGVGQFQNGDDGLGAFFLASESLALATLAGTLAGYLYVIGRVQSEVNRGIVTDWRRFEAPGLLEGLSIANWTSLAAFGVLGIAGIVEAELSFRPTHAVRRRRVVPPELLEGIELSVALGGLSVTVSF